MVAGGSPYHWRNMSEPAIERLAASRLLSRLPPLLRSPFALNNFIYFGGNLWRWPPATPPRLPCVAINPG